MAESMPHLWLSFILLQQIMWLHRKISSGFSNLFIIMLIYLAALGIMGFLEAFLGKLLLRNVSRHLRDDIFRGVITKEPVAYTSRNTADYLSALVNDVKLVEENYLTPLMLLLPDGRPVPDYAWNLVLSKAPVYPTCWFSGLYVFDSCGSESRCRNDRMPTRKNWLNSGKSQRLPKRI